METKKEATPKKAAERAAEAVIPVTEQRGEHVKDTKAPFKGGPRDRDGKRPPRRDRDTPDDGLQKKVVQVNRVTKVVKGGKNMRFTALVVVGDGKGKVGVGMGKANEVSEAIEKATTQAKRYMITVPMVGTTIPHQINGRFSRSNVLMMPAREGTGVIAGSSVRAVLEVAGVKDIRTKSLGSRNPVNAVKATLEGLKGLTTVEKVAYLRGKTVEEILG